MLVKEMPKRVARVQLEIHNDGLYVAVYDHEDDQEHEHNIHQGRNVDVRLRPLIVGRKCHRLSLLESRWRP